MKGKGNMLSKIMKKMDRGLEALVVFLFILMVIVGGMQVFNRFVLNQSLSWSEEFQKFTHIWIIFLAIPIGYGRNSHIGMEIFVSKLPRKLQTLFGYITDLLWLALALALTRYTFRIMQIAKTQTSPGLNLRMDWVYMGLFIGGAYLILMSVRKIIERTKGV